MAQNWDSILDGYVHHLISPGGKDTFESAPQLVEKILSIAGMRNTDTVVDIGCGWGNFTLAAARRSGKVIGIEPDRTNIKEAKKRSGEKPVLYIQGSFEKPNYTGKADIVVSSLVFHQVKQQNKVKSLLRTADILNPNGRFILCDVMILFDAEKDASQFNEVYRYLLCKTTPREIYRKRIEPNLEEGYVYTWNDMKQYTPKDDWFYSINELEMWLSQCNLKIVKLEVLCPFLGIVVISQQT